MQIHIKTKGFDLTPSIETHINEKVAELEKFITQPLEAVEVWVDVGKTTNHHRQGDVFEASLDVKLPGKDLRSAEIREDLPSAINEATEEMKLELRKYKEKGIDQSRKNSRLSKVFRNLIDWK